MEYGSHVWRCSTHIARLNKVEFKAFRLINSPPLTDCLDSLSQRRNITSLALFYRYFHAECSSELANCLPPPLPRSRCTRHSTSHPYSVHLSSQRRNIASLALFYRYFHADCSSEFANCLSPSLPLSRCTRLSTSHPYSVHLYNARVNQYLHSCIPYTGKHWNSFPLSIFPPAYDLNSFKRGMSRLSNVN